MISKKLDIVSSFREYGHAYCYIPDRDIQDIQYIYILYNEVTKLYKIGISMNPDTRVAGIRTVSGIKEIHLLKTIRPAQMICHELERFIHSYFEDKRVIGEWFSLASGDMFSLGRLCVHLKELDILGINHITEKDCFIHNELNYNSAHVIKLIELLETITSKTTPPMTYLMQKLKYSGIVISYSLLRNVIKCLYQDNVYKGKRINIKSIGSLYLVSCKKDKLRKTYA